MYGMYYVIQIMNHELSKTYLLTPSSLNHICHHQSTIIWCPTRNPSGDIYIKTQQLNMRTLLYIILSHLSHGCYSWSIFNDSASSSRRTFVHKSAISTVAALVTSACVQPTQIAVADSTQTLVDELELSKVKLEPIKQLLEENEWDKVRQILKSPAVNKLWILGDVSYFHWFEI